MNLNLRIFGIVCGAATLAVLIGGGLVGVQPQLAAADAADQSTAQTVAQNQQTQMRIARLSATAAKQQALEAENATLLTAMPEILKPNRLVRRVDEVAALNGVSVQSVATGTAVPYSAPVTGTVAGTVAAPKLAVVDSSVTAANFTAVPLTITVTGTAEAIARFAHDIQDDERAFAITSYQTSTNETGEVSGTIGGLVYTLKR